MILVIETAIFRSPKKDLGNKRLSHDLYWLTDFYPQNRHRLPALLVELVQ